MEEVSGYAHPIHAPWELLHAEKTPLQSVLHNLAILQVPLGFFTSCEYSAIIVCPQFYSHKAQAAHGLLIFLLSSFWVLSQTTLWGLKTQWGQKAPLSPLLKMELELVGNLFNFYM